MSRLRNLQGEIKCSSVNIVYRKINEIKKCYRKSIQPIMSAYFRTRKSYKNYSVLTFALIFFLRNCSWFTQSQWYILIHVPENEMKVETPSKPVI